MNQNIKNLITRFELEPLKPSKMSKYEMKEGRGAAFKNDEKKSDKHPDFQGSIKLNGEEKNISMWWTTSKSGKEYWSISVSEKKVKDQPKEVVKEPWE